MNGLRTMPCLPAQWVEKLPDYLENQCGFDLLHINLNTVVRNISGQENILSFEHLVSRCASQIAVHETYFLRHQEQFDWLEEVFLNQWLSQKDERQTTLKILSAGCSTGEEPYSIYAHLAKKLQVFGFSLQVDALDISSEALAKAEKACYGLWSLRGVQLEKEQWLVPHAREVEVQDWVKQGVNFKQHNLMQALPEASYDLILCRNVLIYMHHRAVNQIVQQLLNGLSDDGVLLLGPSDPAPLMSGLCMHWHGDIRFYTKSSAAGVFKAKLATKAPQPIKTQEPLNPPSVKPLFSKQWIQQLIKQKEYEKAKQCLEHQLENNALDVFSYVSLCLLALDLNDLALARSMCKKALFLAPEALYIVYLMSQIDRKQHRVGVAKQLFWLQQQLLRCADTEILPYSDGVTVAQLKGVLYAS